MPSTPILGITQVSTSQNGKETTINDAILALENATNAKLEVSLAAGNVTLTGTEATRNFIFKAVGATAARELLFPAAVNGNPYDRVIVVRNESGYGLTVRYTTSGLTTVTIPDGESRLISADAATGMDVAAEPPSVISFLSLTDAPDAYTSQAGKFLAVNVAENALEFVTGAQFPTLAGNAGKYLTVNGSATGVVWTTIPDTFLQLTDTPSTFTGQAGKLVRVNSAATGLEFITPEETEAVTYVSAQRWRILALEPGIWPENPPGLDPSDPSYITPTEQVGFGEIVFLDQDGVAIDTTGGTASASNEQSGFEADQAFNGIVTTGDGWRTEASYTGEGWIEYEFAGEIAPRRVSLTPISGSPQFGPMRFLIQYWDGSAWINMGDRTAAPWETDVPQIFRINGVPLVVLPDAPVNGSIYGRKDGEWTKINADVVSTSVILYDLDGSHVWQYRRFTNAGTKTIFIRTEAAHAVPADGEWFFYNATGGALTIDPASGVTVNAPAGGSLVVPARGTVRLKRVALNTYDLLGDTVSTESGGELPPLAGNANRLLSVLADESGTAWITAPVTYTDEQARDAVGAALVAGTNVTINVNDAANTITIAATGIGLDVEEVRDTIAATLVAGTNIGINVNDALDTITLSTTALDAEGVRDTIGATLVAGSNVSINVNDAANTITIASSMDQEVIRDTVAASLVAGSNILITHDDAANTITIDAIGSGGGGGVDAEAVRDLIGATLTAGTNVSIAVDDVADTVTISATTDPEVVRDTIGSALVAGSNITITPNDGADTITVAASMDQEVIRDTVAAALVAGTNVVITHNDAANTITIDASGAGTDPEIVRDTMAAALVAGSNVTITPNDLGDTITIAAAGTDAEIVRDTIGSALVAGSNVTIAVNDAANTITISAAGTDSEIVRDTIGATLTSGTGISIAVDDVSDTITISSTVDAEFIRDTIGSALAAGSNVSLVVDDAANTITISAATDPEVVRDTISDALVAGTNITIDRDDVANTITINSTGGGGSTDPEVVRDTIAAALVAGSGISINHNDAADTITISATGGSGGGGGGSGGPLIPVAQVITTGSQSEVIFASIPDTFENLIVMVNGRTTRAGQPFDDLRMQVNSDTGANYDSQGIESNNNVNSNVSDPGANHWNIGWLPASTSPADAAGHCEVLISNYRRTTFEKTMFNRTTLKTGNSASGLWVRYAGGFWRNKDAITSIRVFPQASNFVDGTVVTLYGQASDYAPVGSSELSKDLQRRPPRQTSFPTVINTPIVSTGDGSLLLAGGSGNLLRALLKPVQETNFTVTTRIRGWGRQNFDGAGLFFRDTSGKYLQIGPVTVTEGTYIEGGGWGSDTVWVVGNQGGGEGFAPGSPVPEWYKADVNVSTNAVTWSYSFDGENWQLVGTATYLGTIDAYGIGISHRGSYPSSTAFLYYEDGTVDNGIEASILGGGVDLEMVRDTVASTLVAGSGIGINHDDAGNNITITATGVLAGGAQTPSIRATGAAINFSNSTVNVPFPSGTQAGDTVIIFTHHGWDPNIPSGWIQLDRSIGLNTNGATIMRVVNAADITAGSVTLTYAGSFGGVAQAITIVGGVSPRSISAQRGSSLATSNAFNNTNTSTGDLLLGFFGSRSNTINTLPAGWTTRASSQNTDASSVFGTLVATGTSYTGTATASGTGAGIYTSLVSIVAPNGGNGVTQFLPIVTISDTAYDLPSNMAGRYLRFTATTDKVLNVRADSVHPMPAEVEWHIRNAGAGSLTIIPGGGVTINAPAGGSLIVPPNGVVTLKRTAIDTYDLAGSTFNGSTGVPYTLPFGFTSRPFSAETLLLHVFAEAVVFPAEFSGSTGRIGTAATANSTFSIRKNGTVVGSIVVTPAGGITFASLGGLPVSFASGDLLTVVSPDPADTTLANCAFNLRGARI